MRRWWGTIMPRVLASPVAATTRTYNENLEFKTTGTPATPSSSSRSRNPTSDHLLEWALRTRIGCDDTESREGPESRAAVPVGDGGDAPVMWRCTRYVAVHPNRRGVMPTDRVHCPHQQAQPRIRTPPHGQALHHWACAHVVEGLFMRLWSRPLIVAGIGVVPQEPEEGPAAVPVGDGRAWPGFEG